MNVTDLSIHFCLAYVQKAYVDVMLWKDRNYLYSGSNIAQILQDYQTYLPLTRAYLIQHGVGGKALEHFDLNLYNPIMYELRKYRA